MTHAAIPEDDSGSLTTLVTAFEIASSTLGDELTRWNQGERSQKLCLHLATLARVNADLSHQLNDGMLKAAGEFVPASMLA